MTVEQESSSKLLNGFIRLAQYLIGLPKPADLWQEAPKALVKFFQADIAFVAGRRHHEAVICPTEPGHAQRHCLLAVDACRRIIEEVINNGFLASEMIALPEHHAVAVLPISHHHQVVAVIAVGYCREAPLSREELDTFLGVASLVETILAEKISKKRLQMMADNVPEMLFRLCVPTGGAKDFEYVSQGSSYVLGLSPETLKADPSLFFNNILPEDQTFLDQIIADTEVQGKRFTRTVSWQVPEGGEKKYIQLQAQTHQEQDGTIYLDGSAQDITAGKKAEEQIRKAKEEWERTFAAIGDIATIQDADHRILRANRRACQVLGVPPEELVGKFCYEVFHGGTQPCDGCPAVLTALDATIHSAEIVHERLGRTFSVSAAPVCGPNDELVSIIYISKDITEMKALEAQLRQAQKMEAIGTLAGGIAHDFNNILTPVLGYAEIIVDSLPVDSPLAEPAHQVYTAGMRARDLVKQILTFSRQTEQERSPLQIHLVVKEALKLLRSSIPTTIEIKQDIGTTAMVLADPTRINQVVMNLCTNAYHAMRESGGILAVSLQEVTIGSEDYITELHLRPGPYLRLEVSDTGCGMPHHLLERIFEPYFTTKAKGEGTGLGLSVVHGIIASLGGHITVYSEPGKGTTFHVYLPKHLEEKGVAATVVTADPLPRGHEHILVVDDEKVITEMIRLTLQSLGYQVTACIDSRQALELFEAEPTTFDLVISDVTMPHLTGAELAQRLLTRRPELPIILCTGFSEIINEEKARALGIRRLLMKPVLRDELARVLRQVLDHPEG